MAYDNKNYDNMKEIRSIKEKIKLGDSISPDLFSQIPKEVVDLCLDGSKDKKNKSSQVRRFYDELVMWEDKINSKPKEKRDEVFHECVPYIWMISAKLAYAEGRQLISSEFKEIFTHLINEIKNPQTLKQAKTFFEAYIGFAKGKEK